MDRPSAKTLVKFNAMVKTTKLLCLVLHLVPSAAMMYNRGRRERLLRELHDTPRPPAPLGTEVIRPAGQGGARRLECGTETAERRGEDSAEAEDVEEEGFLSSSHPTVEDVERRRRSAMALLAGTRAALTTLMLVRRRTVEERMAATASVAFTGEFLRDAVDDWFEALKEEAAIAGEEKKSD